MITSVNGSFTSDGSAFYFNEFGKQLNKNFTTTDKTGYGNMTNEQVWQLATNAYNKSTTDLEKRLYKAIADYCLGLASQWDSYKTTFTGKLITNVALAQIYKAMAMADGVEDAWEICTKETGGYTGKYPETYATLMVRLNAANAEGEDKTPTDKAVQEQQIAKEIGEEKKAEIITENTPTIKEEKTSTAGMSWLMVLAAVGVGFALLFGGDKKKKKR